jgi:UDP-N-acetylglucosamine:LPS N-acetylglucosamine transferase
VTFVTVSRAYQQDIGTERFRVVNDATRWDKVGLVKMALRLAWILLRERPDVIVSTGAAPGYFAIRFGRLLGAKTVWIDSIANVEEISMTGRLVGKAATLWLTQWSHLAEPQGPRYEGAVL